MGGKLIPESGLRSIEHPLYTTVYVSFVFFIVLPIAYTLGTALFADFANSSLAGNLQLINKGTFLLLAKSSSIAFCIALLSTLLGAILGFLLYKTNTLLRDFFKIALLIPLFISPYILAVAWKDFFYLCFGNTDPLSSYLGVILVLTSIFTPLSMLIIGSALSNINAQLEEAGFVMTGYCSVIFKITLPLIKPALLTSLVLVFIFSISEFSVPVFFGVKVFTTEIFTQFSAFYNHSLALLQSGLLILLCLLLLFSERNYIADAPFLSVQGKGMRTRLYSVKRWQWLSDLSLFVWFLLSVLLPFLVLFVQSFQDGTAKFVQAFELLKPTISHSIGLAFAGALITVFIGFTAAYSAEIKNRKSFAWLLLFVFAIPSTIFGICLIKFYNQPLLDFIYSSYAIILIGYTGKFSFISAKIIGNAIKQIPNSLDEMAQVEGIGLYRRIQTILMPMIMPALFAAFLINFIFCLGELGTTIMLYPPGTEIMPIKVFTIMANAPQALTSSMTLIVFSVTLLIITAFYPFFKHYWVPYSNVNH
jgi:ABC-type Fe3+ transport system permease subunit